MISVSKFIEMIKAGSQVLNIECEYINNLNIFPVPDGDTGSNMSATVKGAIEYNIDGKKIETFAELATLFSKGLLMNARGNSGVILSQIMRGFLSNFNNLNELTVNSLKESFELAKQKSYSSVVNPIEGTILTVIRMISEGICNKEYKDVVSLFDDIITIGDDAVEQTPNFLQELKEVGVVDSGGYGLMSFFKGMVSCLNGSLEQYIISISKLRNEEYSNKSNFLFFDQNKKDEGFGYCSEVIINLKLNINPKIKKNKEKFNLEDFKNELLKIGDSLVCVQDDELVKVHIHTMKPYLLLQLSQKYGEFEKIKIENMTLQYENKLDISANDHIKEQYKDIEFKDGLSIIATSPSKEIADFLINDFNVNEVIIDEQNIAPSVQTFLDAIYKQAKKRNLIIIDNSNLLLAANEVKKIVNSKYKCEVIVAKNIFETIIATSNIDADQSLKEIYKDLNKILKNTLSAVISTSVRNVKYSDIVVEKDNKIGIINKKIVVSVSDEYVALKTTLDKLMKNKKGIDICFLIYGKNSNINAIKRFEEYASEKYGLYCEIKSGNQEIYDYYIGLQ